MSAKRPPISIATNAVMVGDCEAVPGDELVSVQLAIHPFEALINECTLSFAVVRELLETPLEDRTGILNRASDGSEQFQLHTPVPPLALRLFAEIATQKVRLGMKPLQIPANGDRLGEI